MYTYSTFVSTTLPTARPRPNVGTGAVRSDAILLPSGTIFDPTSSAQKRRGIYTLQYPCMVSETTAAAAHTAYQALRALIGVYGKLYRKLHDATTQWLYCRLLDVGGAERNALANRFTQPLTLLFETRQEVWHGALNQDSYAFDASPLSKEINNGGDAVQRDMTITITAQDSAITVLGIANAETGHVSDFHFTGSIAATKSLVIDTGAWSVLNDGSDAWDDFAFESGHAIDEFLRFMAGNNTITFHRTGGDNTSGIQIDHYDAYA